MLVSVTVFATLVVLTTWLPKVTPLKEKVTGCTPEPVRLAVCGLLLALSVTVKVPVFVPRTDGVNVTLIAQLVCAARVVGQPLAVKLPIVVTLVMFSDTV